ncbi:MAG: hypothetical protein U0872_15550, partial [Planctomycetaceae bacterium]
MSAHLELCRTETADGLQLDGAFARAGEASAGRPALLLIHGTGSNLYGSGILAAVAERAVAGGYPVLRVNTRGHDLVASISSSDGPIRGGAAYERFAGAQLDI